ncbi:hypothetical protein QWJ26_05815 [Streptomyces sp. CSDS2]|uniref:pPIWI_RE_Y domain-containing protein n=1 Tax=Streptomyces sp. CSDS2 TaxID=3055051 RepID=UPI0025AFCD12|nr:hypothetical protein [Streptomyces sp. CSDS2]MDN3259336.1 hypothetical protein [Streptomyces sp. CSDS2]
MPATETVAPDPFPDDLVLEVARAITTLAQWKGLRSFSLPYPHTAQLALDRVVLYCLDHGRTAPRSLAELLSWCTGPGHAPPSHRRAPAPAHPELWLIDPVGLMPTRRCLELAPPGRAGCVEQDAVDTLTALERRCASADRYGRCRRFLTRHPVISPPDRFGPRRWDAVVWNKVKDLYEPVPEALLARGVLRLCGTCGLPARAPDDERESTGTTWCETEDCPPCVPFRLIRKPGECKVLKRSLRAFLAVAARTEQEVLDVLGHIGAGYTLLAGSGLGTYRVTGAGPRPCLLQVHDRHEPSLLAGRAGVSFAGATDPAVIVVPRRAADRADYRTEFEAALSEECRGRLILTTPDDLERRLRSLNPPATDSREDPDA